MEYQIIFTSGFDDDLESLEREVKGDVLITDGSNSYFRLLFITMDRIKSEFTEGKNCYLEENIVIVHRITKETILKSIPDLHRWMFKKRWHPLTKEILEKYFFPKDDWVFFSVKVDD